MGRTIKALKRPITTVRQVWEDYQVGRAIRHGTFKSDHKEKECEKGCDEESPVACNEECNENCKEKDNEKCREEHDEEREEEHKDEDMDEALSECQEECSDPHEGQCKDNKVPSQPVTCGTGKQERPTEKSGSDGRKWKFTRGAEFPWRHEQVVDEESNWRGTWVLEVKDLRAMNWGIEEVFAMKGNRKSKKFVRKPTRQLPFPIGQERELLPSEGGQNNDLLSYDGGQDDMMLWLGKP